jgi:exopolysaccharide biosynthesis protein
MTLRELAVFMEALGCADALNLDGGGSSVLILRRAGKLRVLTAPADGFGPFRIRRPLPNAIVLAAPE